MPRKNLIRSNVLPYHVTSRANNQQWFSLPMEQVWELTQKSLKEAHTIHNVEIISLVLMSNHYHLLLRTPDANLDKFMYEFNKRLAFRLKDNTGNINHLLGGRYKWCIIESQKYFLNCYRYIYQNPLRANITRKCEYYPYSSLHSQVFNKGFCVPLHDNIGFKDPHMLNWINEKIENKEIEFIRKGLNQREFDKVVIRSSRRKKEI